MKVYGIYDLKSEAYVGRLMLLPADAAAARLFEDALQDKTGEIGKYPHDFLLRRLGEFDELTGILSSEIVHVTSGLELENKAPVPARMWSKEGDR